MRAAVYETFQGPLSVQNLPDPEPAAHGVVLSVQASGVCRSDWHGWMGHTAIFHCHMSPVTNLPGSLRRSDRKL